MNYLQTGAFALQLNWAVDMKSVYLFFSKHFNYSLQTKLIDLMIRQSEKRSWRNIFVLPSQVNIASRPPTSKTTLIHDNPLHMCPHAYTNRHDITCPLR